MESNGNNDEQRYQTMLDNNMIGQECFFFPVPTPLFMTSLATPLSGYCSRWLDIDKVYRFESDFKLFSSKLLAQRVTLAQQSLMSGLLSNIRRAPAQTAAQRAQEMLATLASEMALLKEALDLLASWSSLVRVLDTRRRVALSSKIFQCGWKSGFDQRDYIDTCLRYHTIMISTLCAALSFNLGLKYEFFGKECKEYYCQSFRLLYQLASPEIAQWTTRNENDSPPESRADSCVLLMKLCLMKIQHYALNQYWSSTIVTNTTTSASTTDVNQDETPFHSDGVVVRAKSLELKCNDFNQAQLFTKLVFHLVALLDSVTPAESALIKHKFPATPGGLQLGEFSLADTLNYLDDYAQCRLKFGAALMYELAASASINTDSDETTMTTIKGASQKSLFLLRHLIEQDIPLALKRHQRNELTVHFLHDTFQPLVLALESTAKMTSMAISEDNNNESDETANQQQQQMTHVNMPYILARDVGEPRFIFSRDRIQSLLFQTPACSKQVLFILQ